MNSEAAAIDFEPIGKRINAQVGQTLLEAAHAAGIDLVAVCGGAGTCGQCQVQLVTGKMDAPNMVEQTFFSGEMLEKGWRLACQTTIRGALKVFVPADSLTTPQRLQLEGVGDEETLASAYEFADLAVSQNKYDALNINSLDSLHLPHPFVDDRPQLSESFISELKAESGKLKLISKNGKIVNFLRTQESALGFAVDLGTTKIAAYLVDLQKNRILAKSSAPNPQIHYGEDVISRILYCMENESGALTLQQKVVDTLNGLIQKMCAEIEADPRQIIDAVVVGNTAMHHLFAGLPVKQLGLSPYAPAVTHCLFLDPVKIGLTISVHSSIYLPENIAGYVGGDHVAMMIASEADGANDTVLALDIGTNTEISLVHEGIIHTCSCASGPTFEGAHIHEGMRASDGAIERIDIEGEKILIQVIGNQKPIGICGSGILDAVAEMRKNEIINERGNFNPESSLVRGAGKDREFVLVPKEQSGSSRDIVITRKDINEILLAKAAIQTGIEILLRTAGITTPDQIDRVIIAGAFGTYLDIHSAIRIGMLPDLPAERFAQIGNAAGSGARMMVISDEMRRKGTEFARRSNYVELTTYPDFQGVYVQSLRFPAT